MSTPKFDLMAAIEDAAKATHSEHHSTLWAHEAPTVKQTYRYMARAAIEAALPHLLAEKDAEIEQIKSVLASMDHFAELSDLRKRRNNTLAAERDEALAEVDRLHEVLEHSDRRMS